MYFVIYKVVVEKLSSQGIIPEIDSSRISLYLVIRGKSRAVKDAPASMMMPGFKRSLK